MTTTRVCGMPQDVADHLRGSRPTAPLMVCTNSPSHRLPTAPIRLGIPTSQLRKPSRLATAGATASIGMLPEACVHLLMTECLMLTALLPVMVQLSELTVRLPLSEDSV